jgi:hypothetical protein
VAYPKKDPDKHAVNAGVSLPADVKQRLTEIAAKDRKSLSRYVFELVMDHLQKADAALEKKAKAHADKAKRSVKKRR